MKEKIVVYKRTLKALKKASPVPLDKIERFAKQIALMEESCK